MRAISVEFAEIRTRDFWPWWLVSVLLLVWSAVELVTGAKALRDAGALRTAALLEQAARAPSWSPQAPPPTPVYARDAIRWSRMANAEIGGIFAAVEAVRMTGVRVISLDVRPEDSQARLEVEGPEVGNLLGYVDEMNAGTPEDRRWALVHLQGANAGGPVTVSLVKVLEHRSGLK